MGVRILLAALAVLLLAVPAATGQGGAPAPTVTLDANVDTLVVSRQGDASITLTASYTSDNPFDSTMQRRVQVVPGVVPQGWSIQMDPQEPVATTAGQAVTFTARVTLGSSASQSEVPVTFTAKVSRLGPFDDPQADVLDPAATAQTQVTLKRDDPLTREVLEGIGPWIWALLGGLAILAVILAVVLARSNRPVVALSTAIKQARVAPGRSVAIPIMVENLTGVEDNVVFHVAPVHDGWAASLPVPELPLDGRRREELHLVVTSPREARPGESVQVGLTAHGAQNPKRPAEVVLEVLVDETEARRAAGDTTPADVQKERAKTT